jgi:hypothetical protein
MCPGKAPGPLPALLASVTRAVPGIHLKILKISNIWRIAKGVWGIYVWIQKGCLSIRFVRSVFVGSCACVRYISKTNVGLEVGRPGIHG